MKAFFVDYYGGKLHGKTYEDGKPHGYVFEHTDEFRSFKRKYREDFNFQLTEEAEMFLNGKMAVEKPNFKLSEYKRLEAKALEFIKSKGIKTDSGSYHGYKSATTVLYKGQKGKLSVQGGLMLNYMKKINGKQEYQGIEIPESEWNSIKIVEPKKKSTVVENSYAPTYNSKDHYEDYLNQIGIDFDEARYLIRDKKDEFLLRNGRYGTLLRKNDPTTFDVGYREFIKMESKSIKSNIAKVIKESFEKNVIQEMVSSPIKEAFENNLKRYCIDYSAIFSGAIPYDVKTLAGAVKQAGGKNIRLSNNFGWSNQPKVVCFDASEENIEALKEKVIEILLPKYGKVIKWLLISEKDWGKNKKSAQVQESYSPEFTTIERLPNGNAKVKITREGREFLLYNNLTNKSVKEAMQALLEEHKQGNTWSAIDAKSIDIDEPIVFIGYGVEAKNNRLYPTMNEARVYCYKNYRTSSEIEELVLRGEVIFEGVDFDRVDRGMETKTVADLQDPSYDLVDQDQAVEELLRYVGKESFISEMPCLFVKQKSNGGGYEEIWGIKSNIPDLKAIAYRLV